MKTSSDNIRLLAGFVDSFSPREDKVPPERTVVKANVKANIKKFTI